MTFSKSLGSKPHWSHLLYCTGKHKHWGDLSFCVPQKEESCTGLEGQDWVFMFAWTIPWSAYFWLSSIFRSNQSHIKPTSFKAYSTDKSTLTVSSVNTHFTPNIKSVTLQRQAHANVLSIRQCDEASADLIHHSHSSDLHCTVSVSSSHINTDSHGWSCWATFEYVKKSGVTCWWGKCLWFLLYLLVLPIYLLQYTGLLITLKVNIQQTLLTGSPSGFSYRNYRVLPRSWWIHLRN